MSKVARWSRLLTALPLAVVILLVGIGLSRAGVIENPGTALWPTYDLLHVDTLQGSLLEPTMWFPLGFHVLLWTLVIYAVISVVQTLRQR